MTEFIDQDSSRDGQRSLNALRRHQEESVKFLGYSFQPVLLEHKAVLQDYLRRYPQRVSGYSFASLSAWAKPHGVMWAQLGPECILLSRTSDLAGAERNLLQPIGRPTSDCCADLLAEAAHLRHPLTIVYVGKNYVEENTDFCASFSVEENRGGANYIYLARDLAELVGGRFSKKRNLISQFLVEHPNWEAMPLDKLCGPLCREALLTIAHGDGVAVDDPSLLAELEALDFTMAHFDELEQSGLLIRIDDLPAAFSIFERQNVDTAVVHFENALRTIKGLYQMINRETARMISTAGYHLINREEELDHPGLPQAKLSYFPLDIYPVFDLTLKADQHEQ